MMNGKLSKGFNLPGGGRQGDNLFPLLFALVVHNLKQIIDHCPAQGITIPNSNSTFKIDQYADDTKLGIGHVNDIDIYTQAIDKFCKASGMKINWDKTDLLLLGQWAKTPPPLPPNTPFNTPNPQTPIRYLGVMIGNNVPLDIEWTKISDKLSQEVKRVLSNKWTSLTTRILHTNTIVCIANAHTQCHTLSHPQMQ